MSKYDANFKKAAVEILPTHKRTDIIELTDTIIEPLNDVNVLFKWFREGNTAGQYSDSSTYLFGQVVRYSRRIYLRNEITEGYSAGIIPTNEKYWTKVSELFIGVDERIRYNVSKLGLEFTLNRYFETTFRNPPLLSDIWIENVYTSDDNFGVGEFDLFTSTTSEFDSSAIYFVSENDFVAGEKDYKIHVPIAVYNSLGSNDIERNMIISGVVKKYGIAGYTFEIITY